VQFRVSEKENKGYQEERPALFGVLLKSQNPNILFHFFNFSKKVDFYINFYKN
jgi:hypothetical protein